MSPSPPPAQTVPSCHRLESLLLFSSMFRRERRSCQWRWEKNRNQKPSAAFAAGRACQRHPLLPGKLRHHLVKLLHPAHIIAPVSGGFYIPLKEHAPGKLHRAARHLQIFRQGTRGGKLLSCKKLPPEPKSDVFVNLFIQMSAAVLRQLYCKSFIFLPAAYHRSSCDTASPSNWKAPSRLSPVWAA